MVNTMKVRCPRLGFNTLTMIALCLFTYLFILQHIHDVTHLHDLVLSYDMHFSQMKAECKMGEKQEKKATKIIRVL